MTFRRSQVIDFSLPIVTDDMTGFLSFGVAKDHGILYQAFDWRVWLAIAALTPVYVAILGLSDWIYSRHTDWWTYIHFCLGSICLDSVKVPQGKNYNKIYSMAWMWMSFILFLAYEGNYFFSLFSFCK